MFENEKTSGEKVSSAVKLLCEEFLPVNTFIIRKEFMILSELYNFKRYNAYHPNSKRKIAYPSSMSVEKCVWDAFNEFRLDGVDMDEMMQSKKYGHKILNKARQIAEMYNITYGSASLGNALVRCRRYHSDEATKVYVDEFGREIKKD